jgi:RNA polymerase sigma-70 factor (ECF subfamily)
MLTAARRSLIGSHRRRSTAERAAPKLELLAAELADTPTSSFPDQRLELLFACTHPALDADIRAPLMLQTVLGVKAARIAEAFLVQPATLGQQLVRAKRRIAATGIPYRVPDPPELGERLGFVLDAIYAAYGTGWNDHSAHGAGRSDLTAEAIHLATALTELLPDEPEAHGLAALLLHSDARTEARHTADGVFVPLAEQDVTTWSRDHIERAERHLDRALSLGVIGPYQLHAAIQSVHNRRAATGSTDWTAIAALHDGLHQLAPSIGGDVARAAAHLHATGPHAANDALAHIEVATADGYQPYWVTRTEISLALGDTEQAAAALSAAIALTQDPQTIEYLAARFDRPQPLG